MDFLEHHPITSPPDGTDCPQCGARARRMIGSPALGVGRNAAMRLHDRTRATADTPDVVTGLPRATGQGTPRTPTTSNPLHQKLPRG